MKLYTQKKVWIPTKRGRMKLLILSPVRNAREKDKTPGVLWIHGGGYATGMAGMIKMTRAFNLVKKYGAVVVTPEYTLSGKAPYPAALEDCYDALLYMKDNADELNVNSSQLMVGGESAGGGLTAAVCLLARDRGDVRIAYQMPIYPMIDDNDTESSKNNHGFAWNTSRNHMAWKLYLGELWGKDVPIYAAPARCTDYTDLPPAYTFIGDKDAFYCETLTFVENLQKAGVEASVDVYPKVGHAFDMLTPSKKTSKAAIAQFEKKFEYALENYFAEQKG